MAVDNIICSPTDFEIHFAQQFLKVQFKWIGVDSTPTQK